MKKNVIVSLADANYFPLLEELISSIKRFEKSRNKLKVITDICAVQEDNRRDDGSHKYG